MTAAIVLGSVIGLAAPPAQAATKPRLRVLDATVTEGTGGQAIVAFAVRLSAPARKALHFTWGTRAGSATRGVDYTRVRDGARATIAKGRTSTVLVVRVAADAIDEPTETFGVHLAGVPSWVVVADANATAKILDDDGPPRLSVTNTVLTEGRASGIVKRRVTVKLSRPSGKAVSVHYALARGTARVGTGVLADARPRIGTLKWSPGHRTASFVVRLVGDARDEAAQETFLIRWTKPVHVRLPHARSSTMKIQDNDGPTPATITKIDPTGPSQVAAPTITGVGPARSSINIYAGTAGDCTGTPVRVVTEAAFELGVQVNVTPNATNLIVVKAVNTVGGTDTACSAPVTYVHDNVAPVAPANLVTDPASPTQSASVTLTGDAETGSTVSVYLSATCTGTPITADAAAFAAAGVQVTSLVPGANAISVTATDSAGNVSPCASTSVVRDITGPDAPSSLAVTGGSPTDDETPTITGDAESGSTVRVYDSASCAGSPVGSDTASAGSFSVTTSPLSEGAHQITARATDEAGNAGTCSNPLQVTVDLTAPNAPGGLSVTGGSPTDDETPTITGDAESGSTVRVYDSASCGGSPVGSDTASAGSFSVTTSPLSEGAHQITALATDAAGHASPCSDPLQVVIDLTPPDAPDNLVVVGGSPTDDATPTVTGGAESGSTVRVYDSASCGGSPVGSDTASAGSFSVTTSTLSDGTHQLTAQATDGLGHASGCSSAVQVEVDTTGPDAPVLDAVDWATLAAATGSVSGAAHVYVYDNGSCTGALIAQGPASDFTGSGIDLSSLPPGSYTISADADDDLGNVGDCSNPESFDVP